MNKILLVTSIILIFTLACVVTSMPVTSGTFRVKDDIYLTSEASALVRAPTVTSTPAPRPHGWIATKRAGGKP